MGIVFFDHRQDGDVAVVGTEPRQWRHDYAVLEFHIADLERFEEARHVWEVGNDIFCKRTRKERQNWTGMIK